MVRLAVIQGIGFVAAGLLIASFQCKRSRRLFILQMSSALTYMLHFFLLGAFSGAASQVCGVSRSYIYSRHQERWAQWRGWVYLLVAVNALVTALTWKNVFSLLPFFGTAGTTVAGWGGNGKRIRLVNLFLCSPAWLTYDIYSGSIPGILCESFCICSILVSVARYGWRALDGNGEEA